MQASANATKHFFYFRFSPYSAAKKTRKICSYFKRCIGTVDEYMLDVEIILSYTNQFQISYDIFGQIRSSRSNPGHFHLILYKLLCKIFPLFLSFCLAYSLLL